MTDGFAPCPRCQREVCGCPSLDDAPYLPGDLGYGCTPSAPCREDGCDFCGEDQQNLTRAPSRADTRAALKAVMHTLTPEQPGEPTTLASRLMKRSDLAQLEPVEPLIENTLSLRSAVVLIGPTGAGKTFLALSWACSVATGKPWLGRAVERAPVLYVVGEGAHGLDARISAWEQAWNTPVKDEDLLFAIRPNSLTDMTTWMEIGKEAAGFGARFIVLDTYSSLAPDGDETKDAATMMRRLADLAGAIDGTTLLVHHPGWSDVERARGGSQIEANADEVILLRGNAHTDLIEMERKKVKEGPAGDKTWLRRKATRGSVIIESARADEPLMLVGDAVETTVRDLFGGDTVSGAQIRDALMERMGLSRTVAYTHVKRLQAAGVLSRSGGTDSRPLYEVV